ncbi:MAG: cupin domain-containing protein [Candidatus Syntrophosphaera sp.]
MNQDAPFPVGPKSDWETFTNTVWFQYLVEDEDNTYDTHVYNVVFDSSARTYWHSHPGGQILLVTSGTGYYQEKGRQARKLVPGDVITIPPDVAHWHGAAPDCKFAHLGIGAQVRLGPIKWLGPVTEEEYRESTAQ